MRTVCVLLALSPTLLAAAIEPPAPSQPEMSLQRYALPEAMLGGSELLGDLASSTGIAGTQLEGLRLRIALPNSFTFESVRMQIVDGAFLVRENSFLDAVGGFLLRLARLLLFGRLVDVGDDLQVPSALWFVLLDGDPTRQEPISVKAEPVLFMKSGDERLSDHGEFVVCRMIAATSPFTELVGVEIELRDRNSGQRLRYSIPRLVVPPLATKVGMLELATRSALVAWIGSAP